MCIAAAGAIFGCVKRDCVSSCENTCSYMPVLTKLSPLTYCLWRFCCYCFQVLLYKLRCSLAGWCCHFLRWNFLTIHFCFLSSQTTFTHEIDDYNFFHPAYWVRHTTSIRAWSFWLVEKEKKEKKCALGGAWVLCETQRLQWSRWSCWMDWNLYSALQ